MKKIFFSSFLVLSVGVIFLYFIYIHGFGISPRLTNFQVVTVNDREEQIGWKIKKSMPTPRTEVAGVFLNRKIYVIGGFDGFGRTSDVVEVYDPLTDSWVQAASLPGGRHHASAVVVDNMIYVIGGFTGNNEPKSDVFVYNETNNTWDAKRNMPSSRGAHTASAINNKIYVVGGVTRGGLTNKLEIYDPFSDLWFDGPPAPTKRDHLTSGVVDGILYVAGGREESWDKNLNVLEIFNTKTNTWREGSPMPTARGGIGGGVVNGLFIVIGGEEGKGTFQEVEAFDALKDVWVRLPNLPTPRHGLAVVASVNEIYVIGGGKRPGLSVSGNNEVLVFEEL